MLVRGPTAAGAAVPGGETSCSSVLAESEEDRKPKFSITALLPGFSRTSAWLLLGLFSYVVCVISILGADVGDRPLMAAFEREAPRDIYSWAMVAFCTAFSLNVLSLLFEQVSSKRQLVLLACYVNTIAASFGFLSWRGLAPVVRDIWGGGLSVMRVLMWLHTTPAMVFLLSLISDFGKTRTITAVVADFVMIATSIVAHLVTNVYFSGLLYVIAIALFRFVIVEMWRMYDFSIAASETPNSRFCLKVLRLTSVGLWFTLPATFAVVKLVGVSLNTEEWMWTMADFLGKVTFSSSLLYGNFMTMEERRLADMRRVEEGNRMQVMLELQDLVSKKERFMSSISHELRTPLNGIIGLSESLLASPDKQQNLHDIKAISMIKTSGLRLMTLINNVLDADSMRTGKLVMNYEQVDLAQVARDVVQICQPLAHSGVIIKNGISPMLPPVKGDKGRIVQIFFNLIGNACKFTEHGHITLEADVKDGFMHVAIQDTGIGIQAGCFEQIFQAFEQVDMSATRKYGGTGLGLNLVKQLVEAQGGTVSIESVVDKGTLLGFSLQLWKNGKGGNKTPRESNASRTVKRGNTEVAVRPAQPVMGKREHGRMLARAPGSLDSQSFAAAIAKPGGVRNPCSRRGVSSSVNAPEPAPAAAPRPGALARGGMVFGRRRSQQPLVLSVDDDPVNQLVVQNLLIPEGYKVVQAMDGYEALTLLDEMDELPDVILLDVMMPGLSGYSVCAKLRAKHPFSCVPVIMVSAKSKSENIVEGLNAGSNDYVTKPFGRTELLSRISAHMQFRDTLYAAASAEGQASAGGGSQQLIELQHENAMLEQRLKESEQECGRLQAQAQARGAGAPAMQSSSLSREEVKKLRHDKDVLEKQLVEVSVECERLQSEVDAANVAKAEAPAGSCQDQVAALQAELDKVYQQMEMQMEEAEEELKKMEQDKRSSDVELSVARRQLEEQSELLRAESGQPGSTSIRQLAPPTLGVHGSVRASRTQSAISVSPKSSARPLPAVLRSAPRWSSSFSTHMHSQEYAQLGIYLSNAQASGSPQPGLGRRAGSLVGQAPGSPRQSHAEGSEQQGEELVELLREADLEWLLPKFLAEDITSPLVRHLDDEQLKELGVSNIGARLRLRAIAGSFH